MSYHTRDEHHCDLCGYYVADSDEIGRCAMFYEDHYPTDGENCNGWKYWEDVEHDANTERD